MERWERGQHDASTNPGKSWTATNQTLNEVRKASSPGSWDLSLQASWGAGPSQRELKTCSLQKCERIHLEASQLQQPGKATHFLPQNPLNLALGNRNPLAVSTDQCILDTSHKQNNTICDLPFHLVQGSSMLQHVTIALHSFFLLNDITLNA